MSVSSPGAVTGRMLKIRFGELLQRVGSLDAAAGFCRVSRSTLARYASLSPADADCFAPIDVVADLEQLVGEPTVTEQLASFAARALFTLPEAPAERGDFLALLGLLGRENGELTQVLCKMVEDGVHEPHEAALVVAEIDQQLAVLARMRALASTIVGSR